MSTPEVLIASLMHGLVCEAVERAVKQSESGVINYQS